MKAAQNVIVHTRLYCELRETSLKREYVILA